MLLLGRSVTEAHCKRAVHLVAGAVPLLRLQRVLPYCRLRIEALLRPAVIAHMLHVIWLPVVVHASWPGLPGRLLRGVCIQWWRWKAAGGAEDLSGCAWSAIC